MMLDLPFFENRHRDLHERLAPSAAAFAAIAEKGESAGSLAVDDAELLPKAYEVADRLASGSQSAIRLTKYALNNWLRQAGPIFDTSLALEFMGFGGPDVHEGVASLRERRAPRF